MDSIITNLQILSSSPAVRSYDNDSLGLFDEVQDSTNELPDFYMWLNREGKLVWISGINNTAYKNSKGIDLSNNQYFTVPRYTFAPYYSEGTIESIDSMPTMYISYPIVEEHNIQTYEAVNINNTDMAENGENASPGTRTSPSTGTFKGVVIAAISFDVTNSILKKHASFSSEVARNSVQLLDKRGEILLYSEDVPEKVSSLPRMVKSNIRHGK